MWIHCLPYCFWKLFSARGPTKVRQLEKCQPSISPEWRKGRTPSPLVVGSHVDQEGQCLPLSRSRSARDTSHDTQERQQCLLLRQKICCSPANPPQHLATRASSLPSPPAGSRLCTADRNRAAGSGLTFLKWASMSGLLSHISVSRTTEVWRTPAQKQRESARGAHLFTQQSPRGTAEETLLQFASWLGTLGTHPHSQESPARTLEVLWGAPAFLLREFSLPLIIATGWKSGPGALRPGGTEPTSVSGRAQGKAALAGLQCPPFTKEARQKEPSLLPA